MNLFDMIGPVMIGPSSSHTAGAARIGRVYVRMARATAHGRTQKDIFIYSDSL